MTDEKTKSNFWKPLFITLGIIGGLIVICITAVIIAIIVFKPFDLNLDDIPSIINSDITESSYDHPLLTEDQEIVLESVGIDVSALPTEITQEQIDCGIEALGQERVLEIMAGSAPTFTDIIQAQHCY